MLAFLAFMALRLKSIQTAEFLCSNFDHNFIKHQLLKYPKLYLECEEELI